MDLQSVFYLVSIVFIFGWLVLLLVIIFGALVTFKGIRRNLRKVEEKMESKAAGALIPLIPVIPMMLTELKKWMDSRDSKG